MSSRFTLLSLLLVVVTASHRERNPWSRLQRQTRHAKRHASVEICIPSDEALLALGRYAGTSSRGPFAASLTPVHLNLTGDNVDLSNARGNFIDGSPDCALPSTNIDEPVSRRAICPWRWEFNYNPHRLPSVIYEARCSCPRRSAGYSYECEPVLMKMKVLVMVAGCGSWEEAEEVVHLGCVAVLPASQPAESEDETQNSTPAVSVQLDPNIET